MLAIDDLGDNLDAASAVHLSFAVRQSAAQVWVTTHNPSVAEVFEPQEVVRLGQDEKQPEVCASRQAAGLESGGGGCQTLAPQSPACTQL